MLPFFKEEIPISNFFLYLIFSLFLIIFTISCNEKRQNIKYPCGTPTELQEQIPGVEPFIIHIPNKWDRNELRVYFVDTRDRDLMNKTIDIANEWTHGTSVYFTKTDRISTSEIRVSFRVDEGYRSLIGNQAIQKQYQGKPTLWLHDLDKQNEAEFRRVVLHEFGHALGVLHEFHNPNANILWDSTKVYTYFDSLYKWDKNTVDRNVFKSIKMENVNASSFDKESIMIYAIPEELTRNGITIPWPNKLSKQDKVNIKNNYRINI